MLRITKDDLLLFKYCFEQNILIRDNIKNYIWEHKNNSYIDDRLASLIKEGYLKKFPHPFKPVEKLISATEQALTFLDLYLYQLEDMERKNSKLKYFDPQRYSVSENYDTRRIKHDLELNEIRFKLEDLGVDYWQSFVMMATEKNEDDEEGKKSKYGFYPDSIFEIGNQKFFLEFDCTNSYNRLHDTLMLYRENELKNIIYIFKQQEVLDEFIGYLSLFDKGIYYGLLNNINNNNLKFKNFSDDILDLGRLLDDKRKR